MKKILIVFGTRPEAIKMCPLVLELKRRNKFEVVVCVTGQHKQMLHQVLDIFNIKPDYDLAVMQENQSLFDITNNILKKIKSILETETPALVLVHGDTTTTFSAALAAFYMKVPVGHIEAGLRTYDIFSPYPEEFNRQAVSIIASYHFAPTKLTKANLLNEGKRADNIFVTGNTAIDALKTTIKNNYSHPELVWAKDNRIILVTVHRRENIGVPMEHIFRAIKCICNEYSDVKVIYPIHMNPIVRRTANKILGEEKRVHIIEPLDVVDFHNFINRSFMLLTDSGGIQEEAPSLGKPVLVVRNTTERPEGVDAGILKLVGTNEKNIYENIKLLLENEKEYKKMSKASNPYGDGTACQKIADILENNLCYGEG